MEQLTLPYLDDQDKTDLPITESGTRIRWIPGYEGMYAVTDSGRVWSCRRRHKWLTIQDTIDGYKRCTLSVGGVARNVSVHSLVLNAFVGPRPFGHVCRHLNGVRDDNRVANLAWGTPEQNYADRHAHGTDNTGERHWQARLTEADVVEIRRRCDAGEVQSVIAKDYGISRVTVSHINVRRLWGHVP